MNEREDGEASGDSQGFGSDNQGFNDFSALKIRLDTTPILRQIELYLRGIEERVNFEDGEPRYEYVTVALPKANATGVHSIMAWMNSTLNPQVVQGNFQSFEELSTYLSWYRMDLAEFIMNNRVNWEVELCDFEGTIDMIMIQIKPFMSRLVGNKERESYASTIKHSETTSSSVRDRPRSFGFKIPGLGG